jgi:hypothetical protein
MTGRRAQEPVVEVLEDDSVLELPATGLTRIETHGATSRLLWGTRRRKRRGLVEVVVVSVVVPTDMLATIGRQLLAGDVGMADGEGDDEPVRLAS